MDVAERFADGKATKEELEAAYAGASAVSTDAWAAKEAAWLAAYGATEAAWGAEARAEALWFAAWAACAAQAAAHADARTAAWGAPRSASWGVTNNYQTFLVREIFENPRQEHVWTDIDGCAPLGHELQWFNRRWLAWNDGAVFTMAQTIYDEHRFDDLPILATKLEKAGCTNKEMLDHCREPYKHVRGCWVIDLLLGQT